MSDSSAFGEVIRSDSQELEVECHRLYGAPAFGSFVRADCVGSGRSHYAVVAYISTGPFDGARIVQAHGLAPGELEQRKPHLPTVLRTLFRARLVGYGQEGSYISLTPPVPPRLHCFIYPATPEEVRGITSSPNFLRALVNTLDAPLEDLLFCAVRSAREAWGADAPLVTWGKHLARLLHRDYMTLERVIERLSPGYTPAPAATRMVTQTATQTAAHPRWEERLPLSGNGSLGNRDPFEEV